MPDQIVTSILSSQDSSALQAVLPPDCQGRGFCSESQKKKKKNPVDSVLASNNTSSTSQCTFQSPRQTSHAGSYCIYMICTNLSSCREQLSAALEKKSRWSDLNFVEAAELQHVGWFGSRGSSRFRTEWAVRLSGPVSCFSSRTFNNYQKKRERKKVEGEEQRQEEGI